MRKRRHSIQESIEQEKEEIVVRKSRRIRAGFDQNSQERDDGRESRPSSTPPDLQLFNPKDYYKLSKTKQKKWKKGPVTETEFVVKTSHIQYQDEPKELALLRASKILKSAIADMVKEAPKTSHIYIHLTNPNLNFGTISSYQSTPSKLDIDALVNRLGSAIQSDEKVHLSETVFHVNTYVPKAAIGYTGPGIRNRTGYNLEDWAHGKKGVYDPMNNARIPDRCKNLCILLIIVKELYLMSAPPGVKRSSPASKNFLGTPKAQEKALQMSRNAGFKNGEAVPLSELDKLAKVLPSDVTVNFYDDSKSQPFHILGPIESEKCINIFIAFNETEEGFSQTDFHAYGIVSMKAFAGERQWCPKCKQSYRGVPHKCPQADCELCSNLKCKNRITVKSSSRVQCQECNLNFFTKECMAAHQPTCGRKSKCPKCGTLVNKKDKSHNCGKPLCHVCNVEHTSFEFCYVQKDKKQAKKKEKRSIWYADTETQQDKAGIHHVNLLILQKDSDPVDQFTYYTGPSAMRQFTMDCMAKHSKFKNATIFFHNGGNFDAHFWWKELVEAKAEPKGIIRKGQKILSFQLSQNHIIFRDSINFIPNTPLSAFPKLFGLDSGAKGEFPHALNTDQWIQFGQHIVYSEIIAGVVHRFPPIKYFWPEKMRGEKLAKLQAWHQKQVAEFQKDPSLEYCPEDELLSYCENDVLILNLGFTKYIQTWLEQHPDIEPVDSITGPALINKIFRNYHMEKDTLCVLPPMGYYPKNIQFSNISLAWIGWMERELKLDQVRTARKGYEVKLGGHHVDGTGLDKEGHRHVLNYHGCFWHGHKCGVIKNYSEEMQARHDNSINTDKLLTDLGSSGHPFGHFTYHKIYGCELEELRREDEELDSFIEDYLEKLKPTTLPVEKKGGKDKEEKKEVEKDKVLPGPLRPRDAMRGGRTEVIQHRICPVQPGYSLHDLDFTSLYPSVNFGLHGEEWPIGHPTIYIGKDLDTNGGLNPPPFSEWFGLAKVVVLPPRQLKIPVLPEKVNDRLLFHLCSACARSKREDFCQHHDTERVIQGTFFTGELQMATEHGYKVLETHELWHWPKEQRTKELFRSLLKDQLGKKIKSSSPPQDDAELEALIQHCQDYLDITLTKEDFQDNPALRALAKFAINNIWGFLGKHNDVEETEVVTSFSRLLELENDKDKDIKAFQLTEDEEYLLVTMKPKTESASKTGNIVLAVLTTAYARMALYRVLSQYSEEVVYMDTDSVFLYLPNDKAPPPSSQFVGELKDEVADKYGPGASMSHFVSIGPKSYSYQVKGPSPPAQVVKMKGISFTSDVTDKLSFNHMDHLSSNPQKVFHVEQHGIRKDFVQQKVWNAMYLKLVRRHSDKRWLKPPPSTHIGLDTQDTLPYGFCA